VLCRPHRDLRSNVSRRQRKWFLFFFCFLMGCWLAVYWQYRQPAANEVFRILSDLGITLKARKCYLGFHSLELLGYLVDRLGLMTTEAKSDAIAGIPFPATLSQLEYFIGLTNWNCHLVPYYAQRVAPLHACKTALLKHAPQTKRARKMFAASSRKPAAPGASGVKPKRHQGLCFCRSPDPPC
jgi:hypothetical protein